MLDHTGHDQEGPVKHFGDRWAAYGQLEGGSAGVRHLVRYSVLLVSLALLPASATRAQVVSFGSLNAGTVVTDQLLSQGIEFVPDNGVLPVIVADPGGKVARFDYSSGFKYPTSGARGIFQDAHQLIRVHAGLTKHAVFPPTSVPVQADLTLTAFDAAGNVVSSTTKTLVGGAGFSTEIFTASWVPNIVSITLELSKDQNHNAVIALLDVGWMDLTGVDTPDFVL